MNILEAIILISLKIIFMYGAMQEGHILFWFRKLLERFVALLPISAQFWLRKPLFDCMFCMSSFWGLIFIFLPLPLFIDIILSVAGLNYLLFAGFFSKHEEEPKEYIADLEDRIDNLEKGIFPLE